MKKVDYLFQYVIYDNELKPQYDDVDVSVEVSNLYLDKDRCEGEANSICNDMNECEEYQRYQYRIYSVEVVDGKVYRK